MKAFDLNLLRVLDAVLSAGSVTAAAERLHLSVPATSHALARLRELVGDPLLVRAGRRLVPTPRALALREPVAGWMVQAQTLVRAPESTDLAEVQRRFVIRAPDGIPIAFGGALAMALRQAMPEARLSFLTETDDDGSALRDGRVDLDIGSFQPRDPEIEVKELIRQRQVALVRAGHELLGRTLTARRYAVHDHVAVQLRPRAPSPVDDALAALGLARRIVLTVAHANVAPLVAARSALVATLSERMAEAMAPSLGLHVLPLGFAVEPETMVMAWHPRHSADAAHTWLRQQLLKLMVDADRAQR